MSEKMLLRMENVTMQFGGVVAVDNLNLEIKQGEAIGIIGGNGAGKSTFIRTMLGLIRPSAGQVEVLGQAVPRDPRALLALRYGDHCTAGRCGNGAQV